MRLVLVLTALFALRPFLNAAPGDVDPLDLNIVGSSVLVTAVQPDGKTIVAGSFTSVLGVPRSNIARLNADGTLDLGFDPKAGAQVNCAAVQADGKVLVGGNFTTLQPNGAASATARAYIARLNDDGTLDEGFDPRANGPVWCVKVQEDGRVLLGGAFSYLRPNGGTPVMRWSAARLESNGTVDMVFDPRADSNVLSIAVQTDGKVILAGHFNSLQPNGAPAFTTRSKIARVHADGSLDEGFDPNPPSSVYCVVVQPDGKVLLAGDFGSLRPNGAPAILRDHIARLHADGTVDADFYPDVERDVRVYTLALQADGKVLFGGRSLISPVIDQIGRVNADGTSDTTFAPKANNTPLGLALQADGRVLLSGLFTTIQDAGAGSPTTRNYFARLSNDPVVQILSTPNAAQVIWTRGGAAPEVEQVTFELSTDGGSSWTPLGAATRIGTTANWQRTGLTLPPGGMLRARGQTRDGFHCAGTGLIEQIVPFGTLLTPYQHWKQTQLGDVSAPDNGNTDGDDYVNLAEYGLVLDPAAFSSLPAGLKTFAEGLRLSITLTRDPARNDVTIEAEAADELAGPWTVVASSVFGAPFSGPGYVGGETAGPGLKTVEVRDVVSVGDPAHPRRYLRLRVRR